MTVSFADDEGRDAGVVVALDKVRSISRRSSSLSRTFSRPVLPPIDDGSSSKAEHLGKRLAQHLNQFKKLLVLIERMPSHGQRQQAYGKLLDALERCEQSAAKIIANDDEVALENGRRRIGDLRAAIQASIAGYTKPL